MERFLTESKSEFPQLYYEHVHRYLLAKEHIEGGNVLDLACGSGYGSRILAEKAEAVTGIDISEEAIKSASATYKKSNLKYKIANCYDTKLPAESFDYIISFETIEHLDSPELLLDEVKRILKPDGLLIISSPDKLEYTDKSPVKNEFHKKELYHEELKKELELRFKNCSFAKQRMVAGSLILSDSKFSKNTQCGVYYGDHRGSRYSISLPEGLYSVAFCSNSVLPSLRLGIFENKLDSAINWDAREQIIPQRQKVQELELELANAKKQLLLKDEQLGNIASSITPLDQGIKDLIQREKVFIDHTREIDELKSKYFDLQQDKRDREKIQQELAEQRLDQIETLKEVLAQKDGQISTLGAQLSENEEQMTEANHNLENLESRNGVLCSENEKLKVEVSKLGQSVIERQARSEEEIADLENTISIIKKENETCVSRLKVEISTLETELLNSEDSKKELLNNLDICKIEIESLLNSVSDIEANSLAAQTRIDLLSKDLSKSVSEKNSIDELNQTLHENLKESNNQIEQLNIRLSDYVDRLEKETYYHQNFEQRYDHLKSTFSWKVTTPLRAIRRTLSRVFK
ncbi:class I SAM-dependent methyltransferase [Pelagicoccus albus]|uniref:Methyltransferase domain-containing protein n=1 Tax=Pelagicoccus albus TaxID=415222 RepID=A0A7X1B7Q9_9BACT|nr:class I SAM-dependent methyltransferase [Pelagicoccus albus]MBC2607229.1 methyltransferase domain-containing protein [Pelagicoccus albus]